MTNGTVLGWRALRWRGWSTMYRPSVLWRSGVLLLLAFVVATYSMTVGAIAIEPLELLRVITGSGDQVSRLVVLEWRLPRIASALVVGAALGVAGALVQTITRNPLGSPDVIGFSAGAYFGVLFVVVVLGGGDLARGVGALGGGFVAAALVWLFAGRGGATGFRLIIVGIAVSTMLTGIGSWLTLISTEEQYKAFTFWSAGSLEALTWSRVGYLLVLLAATTLAALSLGRGIRQLELGDAVAQARGVRVESARGIALGVAILLTAAATAVCGPIQFVALAAPQIARRVVGLPGVGLASSAAMGSLLVLVADLLGDELLPVGLPVGIVTLIFGGAYLTILLLGETSRR